jgi:hypothetical protein
VKAAFNDLRLVIVVGGDKRVLYDEALAPRPESLAKGQVTTNTMLVAQAVAERLHRGSA